MAKITCLRKQQIVRTVKVKPPKGYMDLTKAYTSGIKKRGRMMNCPLSFYDRLRFGRTLS